MNAAYHNFLERLKREYTGIVFVVPSIAFLLLFLLYPMLYNLILSFFNKHPFLSGQSFAGFENYRYLSQDETFWFTLKNGIVYTVASVFLQVFVGLCVALLVNRTFWGSNIARSFIMFPYMLPTVLVIIVWKWVLHDSYGILNYFLQSAKIINQPIIWFDKRLLMTTLVLISVWQFFPFVYLSILARLQTIPRELYKAAMVDGASTWQCFFRITLPQLKNVLYVIALLRIIWMFTKFDTVYLIAGRESIGRYVWNLPVYSYLRTFEFLQAGIGSAIGVVTFLILFFTVTPFFKKVLRVE